MSTIELSGVGGSSNNYPAPIEINLPPPRKQPKQNELVPVKQAADYPWIPQIEVKGNDNKAKMMVEGNYTNPYVSVGDTKVSIEARGMIIDLENGTKLVIQASKDDPSKLVIAAFKDGKMLTDDLKMADGAGTMNIPMGEGKGEATLSLSISGGRVKAFKLDSGDGAVLMGKTGGGDKFNLEKIDNSTLEDKPPRGAQKITIDSSGGISIQIGASKRDQDAFALLDGLRGEWNALLNNQESRAGKSGSIVDTMEKNERDANMLVRLNILA